ncbi:MAG: glycosyltransferase family 4 protein [Desulfuromonadales bacterium]|nr:glycosyltransferase family 4 protein [Desulfuromonadales bacterium]
MTLAFCLFYYFPFGGQQRDFLKIARLCRQRGHTIHVYVLDLNGELPAEFQVTQIKARGFANHRRIADFARQLQPHLASGRFDAVIGFGKMPGLDLYYAADTCYREKVLSSRPWFYRLGGRYRTYAALERAVFAPEAQTEILLIAEQQKASFVKHYGTPSERFHLLPPGISRDRIAPPGAATIRRVLRAELGLGDDEQLLLLVGSAFKTKGLDRAMKAVAALPDDLRQQCRLVIVGQDKQSPFERLARRLDIDSRVQFLGGRDDIPRFLLGADLLLHPAYVENTGTVLVEALAAGLPVLASSVCGYAGHVAAAGGGLLLPEPFAQATMNRLLTEMLTSAQREDWSRNGRQYALTVDLYSLHAKAADLIEAVARRRAAP